MKTRPSLAVPLGNRVLKNPFLVGSGPTVKNVEQLQAAYDAGWAGACLKLAIDPAPYINHDPRYRWFKHQKLHIFTAEKRIKANETIALIEEGRKKVGSDFLIIPNYSFDGEDMKEWGVLAKSFADAGADAVELNMGCPNMSYNVASSGKTSTKQTGASFGDDLDAFPDAVQAVVEAVDVPVIVKFGAENPRLGLAAQLALERGASAVGHTGNWLGIPDIDIYKPDESAYRLQEQITLGCMSGPFVRPMAMRNTYQIRNRVGSGPTVIGAGGVTNLQSAVQHLMVGASALWICTETMLRGFDWMKKLLADLEAYMQEMNFNSIEELSGRLMGNIATADTLILSDGEAYIDPEKCINCGICWKIGHCDAILYDDESSYVVGERCLACSTCVDLCPQHAIEMRAR